MANEFVTARQVADDLNAEFLRLCIKLGLDPVEVAMKIAAAWNKAIDEDE